jgi:hypothetical protein
LFDRLQDVFKPEQLFMDVDNIEPGLDFVKVLREQVAQCDVLISVIGRGWLEARNAEGERRLDDPADFVRIEIESALALDKRVIPVLIGEVSMPRANQLPDPMKPLATRNAVRLTHERFRSDMHGLIAALESILERAEKARREGEAQAALQARQAEDDRLRREAASAEAEAELARRAEDERKAKDAAALQLSEERQRAEAADAARRTEDERRSREAKVERDRAAQAADVQKAAALKKEQDAFALAKKADTASAVEKFLTAYPDGACEQDALALGAALATRERDYADAVSANDLAAFRRFIEKYPAGSQAVDVRKRLRRMQPPQHRAVKIAAVGLGTVLAVTGGVFYWYQPVCFDGVCGTTWTVTEGAGHFQLKFLTHWTISFGPYSGHYTHYGDSIAFYIGTYNWKYSGTMESNGLINGTYETTSSSNNNWMATKN